MEDLDSIIQMAAETFVVADSNGPLVNPFVCSGGLAVELFLSQEDARPLVEYREKLGLEARVERLGDPFQRMLELAPQGVIAFVPSFEPGIEFVGCSTLSELAADRPSALAVTVDGRVMRAVDRFADIDLQTTALYPWQRHDITDCAWAKIAPTDTPFQGWSSGSPLWELADTDAVPMVRGIAELGPWPTRHGAFAFFTSAEEAMRAREAGWLAGAAFHHPREWQFTSTDSFRPRRIQCLRTRVKDLVEQRGFLPGQLVIDPHLPRASVGLSRLELAVNDDLTVRTASACWAFGPRNEVRHLHQCHSWSERDTLHWHGSIGWQAERIAMSLDEAAHRIGALEIGALSAHERARVSERIWLEGAAPPDNLAEAFVLITTEPFTGRSQWRFFSAFPAAVRWLALFERQIDRERRINGFVPAEGLGLPRSEEPDTQIARGDDLQQVLRTVVSASIEHGYRQDDLERVASASNFVLGTLRVELGGYSRDVAWMLRDHPDRLRRYRQALGADADPIEDWLDHNREIPIDPTGARQVRDRIGEEAWGRLTQGAQHFSSGAMSAVRAGDRPQHDYSDAIVGITKAVEVELGELFTEAGRSLAGAAASDGAESDSALARFLSGRGTLNMGNYVACLSPNTRDGSSRLAGELRDNVSRLPGGDRLIQSKFRKALAKLTQGYRNKSAHTDSVDRVTAMRAVDLVLGGDADPGILAPLVAWKAEPRRRSADDVPVLAAGSRRLDLDHLCVEFIDVDDPPVIQNETELDLLLTDDGPWPRVEGDAASVTAVLDPRLTISKVPNGPVVIEAHEIAPDGVLDRFVFVLARGTIERLSAALRRGYVDWKHKSLAVFAPAPSEPVRLRLERDAGGQSTFLLEGQAQEAFRELVADLAEGRYGPVADREQPRRR